MNITLDLHHPADCLPDADIDVLVLAEGDTYRWWLVQCKACGAGVAECHSDRRTQAGTELPKTWMAAHEAWNEAGKHAHELRCALYEADMLAGHDDAFTEWREKWDHLWALRA